MQHFLRRRRHEVGRFRYWPVLGSALAFAAVFTFSASIEAASTPDITKDDEHAEQGGVDYLRQFQASSIEKGLPSVPFGQWIEAILGSDLSWEMNDCGEDAGGAHVVPVCISVTSPSKEITLGVCIGNSEKGVIDPPELFYGQMKIFDTDRVVKHLADLPNLLKEAGAKRAKYNDHPLAPISAEDAIQQGKSVLVQQIDAGLPAEPFAHWFERVMPADSKFKWVVDGCEGHGTQPTCFEAVANWPDESNVIVSLSLEASQRGLHEAPSLSRAQFYDRKNGRIGVYDSLPKLLAAMEMVGPK